MVILDVLGSSAFAGLVDGRYCIGVPFGLGQMTQAIASVVVRALWGQGDHGLRSDLSFPFFDVPQSAEEYEASYGRHFKQEVVPLLPEHGPLVTFCSNSILLFALFHEIRHVTDGHVGFYQRAFGQAVLEEAPRAWLHGPAPLVRLFCELDADSKAFFTLASNTLSGRWFFRGSELGAQDQLAATFLGAMLLLAGFHAQAEDAWHSYDGGVLTAPPGMDRLVNLARLPYRLIQEFGVDDESVGPLYSLLRGVGAGLAELDVRFAPLLLPLSEQGFDRYEEFSVALGSSEEVRSAQAELRKLGFEPTNMPLVP